MVEKHEGRDSPDTKERDTPTPENGVYPENPYYNDVILSLDSTYCKGITLSPNSINKEILYLLKYLYTKKGIFSIQYPRTFLKALYNILNKPIVLDVLLSFMERKATTAYMLHKNFEYSKKSIYNALEFLVSVGLVVKTGSSRGTGGRPTTVYALRDHTPDDIKDAIQRDRVSRTPRYTEVQRITQITLDDYLPLLRARGYKDIYTAEVMAIIKRTQSGFQSRDLYQPVIAKLRERGIFVVSCSTKRISLVEV